MDKNKIARRGTIIIDIVLYAVTATLILNLPVMNIFLGRIFGIILVANGVLKIFGYFSKDLYCLAFEYDFGLGILMIIMGVSFYHFKEQQLILLMIGIAFLVNSLFSAQMTQDAKRFGLKEWNNILILSIICGTAATILMFNCMLFDDRWRWILALTTGSAALLSHYVMVVTDRRAENRK